jgi:hypothetical protein
MFRTDRATGRTTFKHVYDCIAVKIKHRVLLIGPGADDPERIKIPWPY